MIAFKSNSSVLVLFTLSIAELLTVNACCFQLLYNPYINPIPNIIMMTDIIIGKYRLSFISSAPDTYSGLFCVPLYFFNVCFYFSFLLYIVVGEFEFSFFTGIERIRKHIHIVCQYFIIIFCDKGIVNRNRVDRY